MSANRRVAPTTLAMSSRARSRLAATASPVTDGTSRVGSPGPASGLGTTCTRHLLSPSMAAESPPGAEPRKYRPVGLVRCASGAQAGTVRVRGPARSTWDGNVRPTIASARAATSIMAARSMPVATPMSSTMCTSSSVAMLPVAPGA